MDNAVVAFLNMVAVSELGQVILDNSDNGYNVLVGSTPDNIVTFDSYADHPRIVQKIVTRSGNTLYSSAAGRYQILSRMWDAYRPRLSLTDFGPDSQDAIAAQMLKETGALAAIQEGAISKAVNLAAQRWASLPGAEFGQHVNDMDSLLAVYQEGLDRTA